MMKLNSQVPCVPEEKLSQKHMEPRSDDGKNGTRLHHLSWTCQVARANVTVDTPRSAPQGSFFRRMVSRSPFTTKKRMLLHVLWAVNQHEPTNYFSSSSFSSFGYWLTAFSLQNTAPFREICAGQDVHGQPHQVPQLKRWIGVRLEVLYKKEKCHHSLFECKFCDLTFTIFYSFPPWPKNNSCSIRKNNQMIPPTLAETKAHSIAWEQPPPPPHDHNQQQLIATTSFFETCSSEFSAPRSTYIEYMAGKQGKHPKGTNMKYWSGNDVNNFGYIYIYIYKLQTCILNMIHEIWQTF